MAFTPKDWRNDPDTSTPLSAAAIEDLETRVTDYTDDAAVTTSGTGAETGLRIIRGIVTTNTPGTIVEGTGFSIAFVSTGRITVTFTTAFSDVPAVVTGSNRDETFFASAVTASAAVIQLANASGTATEGTFHFIAIGPA